MADVHAADTEAAVPRASQLRRGFWLEVLTVGWNVVEAVVALLAGAAAGSVALTSFGLDSVVEASSGSVLLWRLTAEPNANDPGRVAEIEARAQRLVGLTLLALAAYVATDAGLALWNAEQPSPTRIGIGLALASLAVMWWLAREKRSVAHAIDSRAMEADAFQTQACFWLSLFLLVGILLNMTLGWWWADPVAALGMCWFIVQEGLELFGGG